MRLPRFYVALELAPGLECALPSAAARHAVQVLRLAHHAPIIVFNGDGHDYSAQLLVAPREPVRVAITSRSDSEPSAPLAIQLALGISKGERMDFALQKAVELGVTQITPLFTQRTQVQLDGARLTKRLEHWQGILIAACEQSGRRYLPTLTPAFAFTAWLEQADPNGGLLLDPLAAHALPDLPAPPLAVTLLIGPEGGLDPREQAAALNRGFQGVRLGPRILRTETAPLAAIAAIQALWGDYRCS